MKTAVIDVGGGMRGIYAAGVFDCFLGRGVTFDLGIGVSAGSANLASFIAGQRGRNYIFYTQYSLRRQYMGLLNFFRTKNYVDLDYVYGTLSRSDGENPLDYAAFTANPMDFLVVAAEALTGSARYFTREDIALDNYDALKASSTLPVVCRPYMIDGVPYYDGALADPVPVQKALDEGCDRIVLILTRPRDYRRGTKRDYRYADIIGKKYPNAAEGLRLRAERYNGGVDLAKKLEAEGRLYLVSPDDTCGVDTLTRDVDALDALYKKGLADGEGAVKFLLGAR